MQCAVCGVDHAVADTEIVKVNNYNYRRCDAIRHQHWGGGGITAMACVKCGGLVCAVLVTATCLLAILNPSSPSHLLLCCEPIVLPAQPTYSSISIDRAALGLGSLVGQGVLC